jgi:hypothetical protein
MIEQLIHHTCLPLAFSFKDDGRAAYAYLHDLEQGKVVADVWLYNRMETPQNPEWADRSNLPFRNSAQYSKAESLYQLPNAESEIGAGWTTRLDGVPGVVVLLRGQPIGELFVGDMPGKSLMAAKDGPCARCMSEQSGYRRVPTAIDLPVGKLDQHDKNFIAKIQEHGWFRTNVFADEEGPGFSYTTGFWLAFGTPEVIVFSLKANSAHTIMGDIYRALESGETLPIRKPLSKLFRSHDAVLLPVSKRHYREYLGWNRWFYGGDDFPCVQLVWPDTHGVFPWVPGFEDRFVNDQIDLTDGDWAGGIVQ